MTEERGTVAQLGLAPLPVYILDRPAKDAVDMFSTMVHDESLGGTPCIVLAPPNAGPNFNDPRILTCDGRVVGVMMASVVELGTQPG